MKFCIVNRTEDILALLILHTLVKKLKNNYKILSNYNHANKKDRIGVRGQKSKSDDNNSGGNFHSTIIILISF